MSNLTDGGYHRGYLIVSPPDFAPVLVSILILFGIVGSFVIVYIFARKKSLQQPPNLLIINLALADGVLLTCFIPTVNNMVTHAGGQGYGHTGCLIHAVCTITSAITSLLTMGLIAVSRYISIVKPQIKTRVLSWKVCAMISLYSWIHPIILLVPSFTGWGRIGWHPGGWLCSFDWTYNYVYNFILLFFTQGIVSIAMCFCYCKIYMVYKRSKKRVAESSHVRRRPKREEIRLTVQLIVVFAIYNICWAPYFAIHMFAYPAGDGPPWLYGLTQILVMCNSSVNVLVYLYFNHKFKAECWMCNGVRPSPGGPQAIATSSSIVTQ